MEHVAGTDEAFTIAGSDGPYREYEYAGSQNAEQRQRQPQKLQLGQPMSVALDQASGAVYVVDGEFGRVQQYSLEAQQACAAAATAAAAATVASTSADRGSMEPQQGERLTGRCVQFRGRGGFGFVVDECGQKYFAHHSDFMADTQRVLQHGYPSLSKGEAVEFEARPDAKWGVRAARIRRCAGQQRPPV